MSLFNKLFYKTKNTSTETHTVTVCPLNTQKHTRSHTKTPHKSKWVFGLISLHTTMAVFNLPPGGRVSAGHLEGTEWRWWAKGSRSFFFFFPPLSSSSGQSAQAVIPTIITTKLWWSSAISASLWAVGGHWKKKTFSSEKCATLWCHDVQIKKKNPCWSDNNDCPMYGAVFPLVHTLAQGCQTYGSWAKTDPVPLVGIGVTHLTSHSWHKPTGGWVAWDSYSFQTSWQTQVYLRCRV